MEGVKVTMFSNNVAMLDLQGHKVIQHGKFSGQAIPTQRQSYFGSEYLRRGGHWVNVFAQPTAAKQ